MCNYEIANNCNKTRKFSTNAHFWQLNYGLWSGSVRHGVRHVLQHDSMMASSPALWLKMLIVTAWVIWWLCALKAQQTCWLSVCLNNFLNKLNISKSNKIVKWPNSVWKMPAASLPHQSALQVQTTWLIRKQQRFALAHKNTKQTHS